jgi:hypothetical protein
VNFPAMTKVILLAAPLFFVSCSTQHPAAPTEGQDSTTVNQAAALSTINSGRPKASFPETGFEFGEVLSGTAVEHDFVIRNQGSAPTTIEKVNMTPPLLVTQMPRTVAPGAEGRIHFKLDTSSLE